MTFETRLANVAHVESSCLTISNMGGAIVTHMQHDEPYVMQSVILAVIWIAGFLRYSELLQSFRSAGKPQIDS